MHRTAIILIFHLAYLGGCAAQRPKAPMIAWPAQLGALSADRNVQAYVAPPLGWHADPLKQSPKHTHQVWISPSGATAYGVIFFSLPLPVGDDLALWGFLDQMKKSEGEATVLAKDWDVNIHATRFIADGGLYRVRTNFFVDGFHGWAVYAGSKRDHPISVIELDLAELAREHTTVGLPDAAQH